MLAHSAGSLAKEFYVDPNPARNFLDSFVFLARASAAIRLWALGDLQVGTRSTRGPEDDSSLHTNSGDDCDDSCGRNNSAGA